MWAKSRAASTPAIRQRGANVRDPSLRSSPTRPIFVIMKLIVYGILFLIAASLVVGIVIGLIFKLLWLTAIAVVLVLGLTWLARKLRGPGGVERWRR
jgi:hypothetical protein